MKEKVTLGTFPNLVGFDHDLNSAIPLDDPNESTQITWNKSGQIESIEYEGEDRLVNEILKSVADLLNDVVFDDRPFEWKQ